VVSKRRKYNGFCVFLLYGWYGWYGVFVNRDNRETYVWYCWVFCGLSKEKVNQMCLAPLVNFFI